MAKDKEKKIAIACQGGGSQTAFTAGVLTSFFKNKVHEKDRIVSLSGTSGGAICAALAWQGLLKWSKEDRTVIEQGLESFWKDNGTENLLERFLNDTLIQYVQLVDCGFLPEWKSSPYSPWRQSLTATLQLFLPQFYDFEKLLKRHLHFNGEIQPAADSPVLVIGAADVRTGEFKKFSSRDGTINIKALLASAAVPSFSTAVETGGGAYWDGLFSDNPPTDELIDDKIVGVDNIPDQLWVIQINPGKREGIPKTSEEIIDRRNEMIGNASLYQDLLHIQRINEWVDINKKAAFKEDYKTQHHLQEVKIYTIQMDDDNQKRLNYASKLDRNEQYIRKLMAHGEQMGRMFLDDPESMRFPKPMRSD